MSPLRLEPETSQSGVKHSTTEPLWPLDCSGKRPIDAEKVLPNAVISNCIYSKTCFNRPLKKTRHKLVFNTDHRLMQVKSISECPSGSILQYF